MSKALLISKSSNLVFSKYGIFFLKENIKTTENIIFAFSNEDIVVLGNIETTGSITVEAKSIKFEGTLKHNKEIVIYGFRVPESRETEVFLDKII